MEAGMLTTALEQEHHEIDEGIEAFTAALAEGRHEPKPLGQAFAGLRRHIYLEEEFLFPPLRQGGLVMPLMVMVREHGQLWDVMAAIDAQVAAGAPADEVDAACRKLLALLEAHNSKEEPIIYPQADSTLSPEAAGQLMDFIDSGQMPDGWVPEKATA